MKRSLFFVSFFVGVLLVGCQASMGNLENMPQETLPLRPIILSGPDGESLPLTVETASTQEQHRRGLMFRTSAEPGMLFVFAEAEPLSFWMKNTLVPLDILYFGADGSFISAAIMEPCREDPCPGYPSAGPARYALEVPVGAVRVGTGWKLEMQN